MADRVIVDCLSFQYNGRDVLKDVSLQLAHGCMLGLLGPNGSGKTTLVRCISGFLRPKSGRVLIDGVYVRGYSARELSKRMAMAPQRSVPEFGFTALDIVLMGRNPHIGLLGSASAEDMRTALKAMELAHVEHLKSRSILTLSGGEWQRILIARAICQSAEILLLDEPISSLDIKYQLEILKLVRRLCANSGLSAICVLHDVNLASHYCDKIALLKDGTLYAYGAPDETVNQTSMAEVYGISSTISNEQGRPYVIEDMD